MTTGLGLPCIVLVGGAVGTGPGDQTAAGPPDRGHLRASDADREQVIDTLKDAFVQGRLTRDELGLRAGLALASRTYGELNAITADIPSALIEALIEAQPPPAPVRAPGRTPVNKKVAAWAACAIILPPAVGAAFLTYYGGFIILFLLAFIGLTVTSAPGRRA
jgi:hypothetical protein